MTRFEILYNAVVTRIHKYEDRIDRDTRRVKELEKDNRRPDIILRKFLSNEAQIKECKKRIASNSTELKVWRDVFNMILNISDTDDADESL